ncbi:uncharacterized protein ACHE_20885S [Aspergillus chevalieri]|uniref:Uncharacterized protein n=1 Tax=Aspergillus chevalieri TaxID=182096 RepID=A0A7R7ZLT4_ASPCH|nr:uncharacterized protein ACHE_20885S [Aspergillus chevalieri]BCR85427.1 hypothetical protein ACHE_20885S [Aspergillus chevalieri]
MHLKSTAFLSPFAATTTAKLLSNPSASPSSPALNHDDYDCIYQNRGCDWTKSEYGYGSDYCGH